MNYLIEALNFVSSGLLVPCVAILLILLLQALKKAVLYRDYYKGAMRYLDDLSNWVHMADSSDQLPEAKSVTPFTEYASQLYGLNDLGKANHLVSEYESLCEERLGAINRLAKLGPMLGLLGTLIPMGPALEGLARGDILQLATQMQVAFTTTVVGLVIGAVGYVLFQLERQIITRQLAALDYLSVSGTTEEAL